VNVHQRVGYAYLEYSQDSIILFVRFAEIEGCVFTYRDRELAVIL